MTDTGAGTPPEDGSAMWRELYATLGEQWVRLLAAYDLAEDATADDILDAARPATDPAGLDAAALLRQFVNEGRIRHRLNPRCHELMPMDGPCTCGLREAERLARLSVADGPGPEERPLTDRIDDIARSITALFNAGGQGQPAHSRALEDALAACRAALPVEETGRS